MTLAGEAQIGKINSQLDAFKKLNESQKILISLMNKKMLNIDQLHKLNFDFDLPIIECASTYFVIFVNSKLMLSIKFSFKYISGKEEMLNSAQFIFSAT